LYVLRGCYGTVVPGEFMRTRERREWFGPDYATQFGYFVWRLLHDGTHVCISHTKKYASVSSITNPTKKPTDPCGLGNCIANVACSLCGRSTAQRAYYTVRSNIGNRDIHLGNHLNYVLPTLRRKQRNKELVVTQLLLPVVLVR
jgi:hypothetical protein